MSDLLVSKIDDVAPGFMIANVTPAQAGAHGFPIKSGMTKQESNDNPDICQSAHPPLCHSALDAESTGGDDKKEHAWKGAKEHKNAVVFLHAYGGCKEELVGLAMNMAAAEIDCYVYDLPGHGENESIFNSKSIEIFIKDSRERLNGYKSIYFLGHSIGARIALSIGGEKAVAISPPGETFFEGRQTELLQTLRVRRVKEEAPYEGLKTVLSAYSDINRNIDKCLVLYAKNDIRSSREMALSLGDKSGFVVKQITASNHLDIVTSRETIDELRKFIWS